MGRAFFAVAALALAVAAPAWAAASDESDVVAIVQAFNDAGNKSDRNGYVSYCAEDAVVTDHVPPFVFTGPAACQDDYDAIVAWGRQNRIAIADAYQSMARRPEHVSIVGDRAYAVFRAPAWFTQDGRKQLETLYATFVLRRTAPGWRIASLTWTSLGWAPSRSRPPAHPGD
jgi:ketosteroid isomerase-like protein